MSRAPGGERSAIRSGRLGWLVAILLVVVGGAVCAHYGVYRLFSTFLYYDDEGYVLLSIKYVLLGFHPYNQVYTQYGPLFYTYAWLLHGVLGVGLTNDAVRLVTLIDWIGIAGLYGAWVYRASGSALLTCGGFVLAFMHLDPIVNEPGHPQGICGLIAAAVLLLGAFGERRDLPRAMTGAGLLIGLLAMIKINLGVYLFLAVSVALLTAAETTRITRIARPLHIALALAVTPLVMHHWLTDEWTLLYWILWTLAVVSVLLVARPAAADRIPGDGAYVRLVAGAAAAALAVVVSQLVQGVPLARLVYGVVGQHLAFSNAFYFVLEVPRRAAAIAVAATALAVLYRLRVRWQPAARRRVERGVRGAKLVYGLAVVGAVTAAFAGDVVRGSIGRVSPSPTAIGLMFYGLPFVWLLLAEIDFLEMHQRLARVALCLIAAFQALQVFPIAGTQVALGTVLLLLAGFLCVHDVWRSRVPARRLAYGLVAAALLTIAFLRGEIARREYGRLTALNLPGAARIRLPDVTARDYGRLVRNIRATCDTFVTFPGTNSIYLWTQKEPPTPFNGTFWPNMLDTREQFANARTLAGDVNACFVLDLRQEEVFRGLGYSLLANYLNANFRSAGTIGPYDLRVRNDRRSGGLIP